MNVQVCAFAGLCIRPVWPDLYECTTGQQHACAGFEPHLQGSHQGTSASKCLRSVPPAKSAQLCTGHTLKIVSTVRGMPESASTIFPSSSSSRLAGLQGGQWPGVHQRCWGLYAVPCIAGQVTACICIPQSRPGCQNLKRAAYLTSSTRTPSRCNSARAVAASMPHRSATSSGRGTSARVPQSMGQDVLRLSRHLPASEHSSPCCWAISCATEPL